MKKVLIGIFIGLSLILMCVMFIWKMYDGTQLVGHKVMRRKKYVKVKPDNYNVYTK
nr:hypothetical protein [uncultured Cellulosilyticum sp.]